MIVDIQAELDRKIVEAATELADHWHRGLGVIEGKRLPTEAAVLVGRVILAVEQARRFNGHRCRVLVSVPDVAGYRQMCHRPAVQEFDDPAVARPFKDFRCEQHRVVVTELAR